MALTIRDIQSILPHRYPFLLVDKILEHDEEHIIGIKNVTINEPFFQGHFPGIPIMPGVLILEAMAQVGGILFMELTKSDEQRLCYLAGINNVKFRRPVVPGDQLRLEINVIRLRKMSCKMRGTAYVEHEVVAEGEMLSIAEILKE